ncbi:NUDIX hydrolase [Thioclava sp. 'Guangxiensis']|uniref:NUDIX hydrolase n=1 Tax=Thioclava sp. 'Guangxiensis' TaxID=3149044 RepID=UPI0038784036
MQTPPIHDACSIILWKKTARGSAVLMGQRGAGASFMPHKFVFPGGRLDDTDHDAPFQSLDAQCQRRLGPQAGALIRCGLRELTEETGLELDRAQDLRFVFRAITPPRRSRRFDARFLMGPASALRQTAQPLPPDGELSHLTWVPLAEARRLDLPFVTELVLAEVAALLTGTPQDGVPFFETRGPRARFERIL